MKKYDVIVLGGGPGGYVAAIRVAQLGGRVALVEKDQLGGTCLNRGCIPTKTYVKNAEIIHQIKSAASRGIVVNDFKFEIGNMVANKDSVVKRLVNGVTGLLKANGVDTYKGFGTVTKNNTIIVKNEVTGTDEEIEYEKLIIATGTENFIPPIAGIDQDVLTSTEILNIKEIPKSLIIIGGGVIGCELATVFSAMGTEVTIIEMLPHLLPNLDTDLSVQLEKHFKKEKISLLTKTRVKSLERNDNQYTITIQSTEDDSLKQVSSEKVLISVGRKPNLLGLESLNLEMKRGYITIDDTMRTSIENVYAIGDITGTIQLAHVASSQGLVAASNAMGIAKKSDLSVVPSCIYTIPEIGSVGLTELAAKEKYGEIVVGSFPVMALGKALAMGESEGFIKIIADKTTNKVVGAHIFGAGATETIMELAVAIHMGATLDDIADTIHAHPTMAEGIMEAAHDAVGTCIHMPPKAQSN